MPRKHLKKTKLIAFSGKKQKAVVDYHKLVSSITIDNNEIEFVTATEHVGVVRSTLGNLPHIQTRITNDNKSLFAVLPARNRHANPAACFRVESVHALPVLLSFFRPRS